MSISSISSTAQAYEAANTSAATAAKEADKREQNSSSETEEEAAVYEKSTTTKSDSASQIYDNKAIIAKLKADQQSRAASMQSLVQKLLGKQNNKYNIANSKNLSSTFLNAASMADPATIKQAQEDISEDGYWGVNKTSDRLVSMAIALSGGDTEKADEMMAAIQKGYDKATAAWGNKLPDICKQTLEATKQKMEDWKNGKTTAKDYADSIS